MKPTDPFRPTLRDIEAAVCARFKLTTDVLRGPCRKRPIARPRQIAMFLAREMTDLSYPAIGRHFGRDHTTVIHGERCILNLMPRKPRLADYVAQIRQTVVPRERETARALAAQPLVQASQHAQGGGGFSGRGMCEGVLPEQPSES